MSDTATLIRTQLENNLITSVLVLTAIAAILVWLRNVPPHLWSLLKRQFLVTVDIADHDPAFYWVQAWLGSRDYSQAEARQLTVSTRTRPSNFPGQVTSVVTESDQRKAVLNVVFSPAPGLHWFWFGKQLIIFSRQRTASNGINGDAAYHESFIFHTFSRRAIKQLIYEARDLAFPPDDARISVYRSVGSSWRWFRHQLPRSSDSIILEEGLIEQLLDDLLWFFRASDWYAEHGIPYQRGYMLTGPPGNGKTSLVTALATSVARDIYVINLSGLTDLALGTLLSNLPEHVFVLIEDVDLAFDHREPADMLSSHVTFSGFINSIDGVSAPPGRVLFMTANHPERIDPALIRPGRADRKFFLRNPSPSMARRLFLRFHPYNDRLATEFAQVVASLPEEVSMADLQEHLIKYREDPMKALLHLDEHAREGEFRAP